MDIQDLNKSQLLLLALLLSFITSIATGITTVTLMEQAPDSVTVPINRVIQQTVEKIQQVEGKTTLQTVVVNEEDLVVDAIAKNKSALFTVLTERRNEDRDMVEVPAGRGFLVSDKNIIVSDAVLLDDNEVFYVQNDSGKFKAEYLSTDSAGFSLLRIGEPVDPLKKLAATLPTFGDLSQMKTGQKVLVLGAGVKSFIFEGEDRIKNIVAPPDSGGMVLNLEGEVLGIIIFSDTSPFVPMSVINESVKAQVVQ
jgi:S1-C subfamily serine protease